MYVCTYVRMYAHLLIYYTCTYQICLPLGPNFSGGNLLNMFDSVISVDALSDNCDKSLRLRDPSTSTSMTLLVVPDLIPVITSAL